MFYSRSCIAVVWVALPVVAPAQVRVARLFGTVPNEQFGCAVAAVGDLDGDGIDDLLIGAPLAATTPIGKGRVTLYSGATLAVLRTHDGFYAADEIG